MITAGDFRKGVTFEMDGAVYSVVDFLHVKPGKGSPFVRAKLKNVMTGQVKETTFNPFIISWTLKLMTKFLWTKTALKKH